MSYLELTNVSYSYPNGHQALENVSLNINKGESVAIVGQNGAGKTTMVKLMNGLLKPTDGDVIIDNWNTKNYTTAKISQRVGYVFQNPDDQIFNSNVYKEVAFGPKKQKLPYNEVDERVKSALCLMGIEKYTDANPFDLPLSARKLVTIASVIAINVDVIILDEPTAGQDRYGLDIISHLISSMVKEKKTIITITHDMEFVANNFSRSIVMANKKKIADGDTRDIFWNSAVLEQARLHPPYISRLSKNYDFMNNNIITTDEFINAFIQTRK